jgi:hypothetical protein
VGRPLRYLPPRDDDRWHLVELTSRTVQRRYLLHPSPKLVRRTVGILARAQRLTGARVHDDSFLSNHFHLLASVENVRMQAQFAGYVKRWLTDEIQRLTGWEGKVWDRPFKAALISDEETAQVARLRYLYSQGVKENLVASPEDWPGVTTIAERLAGYREIEGEWVDYTAMTEARKRGEDPREEDYTHIETLHLSPLPAWESLSFEQYRDQVRSLVNDIRREAKARHAANGTRPVGLERLRHTDPFSSPGPAQHSPAPLFHAATREGYRQLRFAYQWFTEIYREAARRYREGEIGVVFPDGCFPPPRHFGHEWHPPPPA